MPGSGLRSPQALKARALLPWDRSGTTFHILQVTGIRKKLQCECERPEHVFTSEHMINPGRCRTAEEAGACLRWRQSHVFCKEPVL